jgi:hypothetical protein
MRLSFLSPIYSKVVEGNIYCVYLLKDKKVPEVKKKVQAEVKV